MHRGIMHISLVILASIVVVGDAGKLLADKRTDGPTEGRTARRKDGRTEGWHDRRTTRRTDDER